MKTNEQMIEVQQAYVDGKNIKMTARSNGLNIGLISNQGDTSPREFNWQDYDYDIVQDPIVRFMVVRQSGLPVVDCGSYARAKRVLGDLKKSDGYRIIKVIEDVNFNGDDE